MNVTIEDVAKLAGVSPKTVSNVINGNTGRFSIETRDRVLEAIKKLNYQPNRAAQFMRSGAIYIIALAITNISSLYHSEIATIVIEAANARGYTVLIEHMGGNINKERLLIGSSNARLVDGVILDVFALGEEELYYTNPSVPIVTIGERMSGQFCDHVMIDNVAASRLLVEHLIELGRRRIGILPVMPDIQKSFSTMRYQGYLDALEGAGIPHDPRLIAMTRGPVSFSHMDGMVYMEELLRRQVTLDAVFCLNDLVALGAMKTLSLQGLRIPDDIAVVGFDDLAMGQLSTPDLTTISPDKQAIGHLAVNMLIDRIEGKRHGPPELIQPAFQLVVRGSTVGERRAQRAAERSKTTD